MRFLVTAVVIALCGTAPFAQGGRAAPGFSGPTIVKSVAPVYPEKARTLKLQGALILSLTVGSTGRADNIRVVGVNLSRAADDELSPVLSDAQLGTDAAVDLGFADASIAAVKRWRWRAATQDGTAVPTQTIVTVRFKP